MENSGDLRERQGLGAGALRVALVNAAEANALLKAHAQPYAPLSKFAGLSAAMARAHLLDAPAPQRVAGASRGRMMRVGPGQPAPTSSGRMLELHAEQVRRGAHEGWPWSGLTEEQQVFCLAVADGAGRLQGWSVGSRESPTPPLDSDGLLAFPQSMFDLENESHMDLARRVWPEHGWDDPPDLKIGGCPQTADRRLGLGQP